VKAIDTRPGFEEIYMRLARELARRSTCSRLQVGTVITSTDFRRVLAVGYNGNASGLPNSCDRDEPGNCGCLHSEENAVINCDAPRATPKIVFVTHLPCAMCAKRLINLGGVRKVYYGDEYRSRESLGLFAAVGIEAERLDGRLASRERPVTEGRLTAPSARKRPSRGTRASR
jgi:dCMP deaminase